MSTKHSLQSHAHEDLDDLPKPPIARKLDAVYAGVVALLCVYGAMWSLVQAGVLIAIATAIRFALVRWVTIRAYRPWMKN